MIITRTPLRISFLGGNTDFREYFREHGGVCLSTTIDKYVYCIVKERFDEKIIVNYSAKETVDNIDDLKHELVRESLRLLGVTKGIEISFMADIPTQGTGLGSSSSVTVGLLNALHTYLGDPAGKNQLAEEAIQIELDILKKPIGVQDQYAVAFGGLRTYAFDSTKTLPLVPTVHESVKEDFNNSLMLLYTGITRKADSVLSALKLDPERLHKNKELAIGGYRCLEVGQLHQFGKLLNEYWQSKKKFSDKITNKQIDEMYTTAMRAGAIGGKVIGAGGGGFLLVMFPANKRAAVRNALSNYKELPFRFDNSGSRVIFHGE